MTLASAILAFVFGPVAVAGGLSGHGNNSAGVVTNETTPIAAASQLRGSNSIRQAAFASSQLSGTCNFPNTPSIPHFWDPTCPDDGTSLGCMADGINPQCRFCGEGAYAEVFCPASWCEFEEDPHYPYFWDSHCTMGTVGCLADGKNIHCRYCGEFPYNGTVHCPDRLHTHAPVKSCVFNNEPTTPYFWDVTCEEGMLGCHADLTHIGCRFCGAGAYAEVKCPASLCTFAPELAMPAQPYRYYWEPECWNSSTTVLGCLADGIHKECRFCGAGEYSSIPCPAWASSAH